MAYRIAPKDTFRPSKATSRKKDKAYLDWVRSLPCVITKRMDVDAAHLSTANGYYGHLGRGKGRKASDRWALPLSRDLHTAQHSMDEMKFWKSYGVNPHLTALVLSGLWNDKKDDATGEAIRYIQTIEVQK